MPVYQPGPFSSELSFVPVTTTIDSPSRGTLIRPTGPPTFSELRYFAASSPIACCSDFRSTALWTAGSAGAR